MDILKKREPSLQNLENVQETQNKSVKKDNSSINSGVNSNVSEKEGLEETRIKKIDVLSFALTISLISIFTGFLLGILVFLSSSIFSSLYPPASEIQFFEFFSSYNFFAILIVPISYGIMGFVSGLIIGAFYNLASRISKGIRLYGV